MGAYDTGGAMMRTDAVVTIEYKAKYTYTGLAATCPYADSSACSTFMPGNPHDFFDARNWSPQGVPGSNDTATIGNFDVVLDTTDSSKGSVVLGGLNLQGGSLSGASLSFSPATGSDNIFNWSGGALHIATTDINATGTFNISGDGLKDLGANDVINNAGTTTFSGAGLLRGIGSSTFNNLSGATFIVKNDGNLFTNYNGSNVFNNAAGATFKKQNDFNAPSSVSTLNTWTFNNSGAIISNTGTLNFNNEATTFADGRTISGSGHTQLSNTTFTGTTTLQNTTFDMMSGYLTGTGTLASTDNSSFNWTSGRILRLNVGAGTNFNLSGPDLKDIDDHGVINNSGHATLSGTGALSGINTSTFNNLKGATFTLTSDAGFGNYNGSNTFNNLIGATFEKTVGTPTTTSTLSWAFNNSGTTSISQGVLALSGDTTSTDSGIFTTVTPGIVRFLGGNHTLKTGTIFTGTGKTQLAGATLNEAGNIGVGSSAAKTTLEVSSGAIKGTKTTNLTLYGTLNWTGGTIGEIFNVASGSAVALLGTDVKDVDNGGIVNNSGTFTWTGTGPLRGIGISTFNNLSGGIFDIKSDGVPFGNYNGSNVFNNAVGATLRKTVGKGTTILNQWTYNLNGGPLSITTGTFSSQSPFNINANTTLSGAGALELTNDTNLKGTLNSSTHVLMKGTLNCTKNNPASHYAGVGLFDWTAGTINGTMYFDAGTKTNLSGADLKDIGGSSVINNSGTFTWAGAGVLRGIGTSTFANSKGGVFTIAADGPVFGNYNGSNVFINGTGATFQKTGGTKVSNIGVWDF